MTITSTCRSLRSKFVWALFLSWQSIPRRTQLLVSLRLLRIFIFFKKWSSSRLVGGMQDQYGHLLGSREVAHQTRWLPAEWDQMYECSVNKERERETKTHESMTGRAWLFMDCWRILKKNDWPDGIRRWGCWRACKSIYNVAAACIDICSGFAVSLSSHSFSLLYLLCPLGPP